MIVVFLDKVSEEEKNLEPLTEAKKPDKEESITCWSNYPRVNRGGSVSRSGGPNFGPRNSSRTW